MTLGFIKQLQVRVCSEEILKGGGLSDGGDEVAGTPPPPNFFLPVLVADSLPPGSLPRVLWPGAGEAGERTWSVL